MDAADYRPPLFAVKKWTLVGFCSVYVFLEIILAAFAGKIADAWIEEFKHEKDYRTFDDIESARVSAYKTKTFYSKHPFPTQQKLIILSVIVSSIIAILFQLMAIVGAIREHFCLVATYTVLHLLSTVASFAEALKTRVMWSEFAWSALITILAIAFLRDLVLIRRQASHQYA